MTEQRRPMTAQQEAAERAQTNYGLVVSTLKGNKGAEAKAIRAMLGGDEALFQRFLATTFALLARDPKILAEATPASLVQSIKDAASMGLEPLTGDGAIIVRKGIAMFQPMWQGHLKRIRNSRAVQDIDTQVIYENDEWSYGHSQNGGTFKHVPALKDRGGYWGVYAYAVMPSGFVELEVMSEADINWVRDHFSDDWKSGDEGRRGRSPWSTSWGEMARKTVLMRLEKRLPSAAVDALIAAEARIQHADKELEASRTATKDELADIRALALRAVGAGNPVESPTAEAQPVAALAEHVAPASSDSPRPVTPHEQEWGPLDAS